MRDNEPEKGRSGLNRLNDRLFKYIFVSRQHKANLIRFLNDVLDDPNRMIADIESPRQFALMLYYVPCLEPSV